MFEKDSFSRKMVVCATVAGASVAAALGPVLLVWAAYTHLRKGE